MQAEVLVDPGHLSYAFEVAVRHRDQLAAGDALHLEATLPEELQQLVGARSGFGKPLREQLREDHDVANTLHLWIVADNLRKGAATNAVQIAEALRAQVNA